jgi:hypothetical protein
MKILILILMSIFNLESIYAPPLKRRYEAIIIVDEPIKIKHVALKSYRWLLKKKESSFNYDTVNSIGAIGAYQFTESTLKWLGYKFTAKEFRANPGLFPKSEQEKCLTKFTAINRKILLSYIQKYVGMHINGVLITEAGILGSAHIGGAGSVQKLFKNVDENSDYLLGGRNAKDKNGTSALHYMAQFGNTYM